MQDGVGEKADTGFWLASPSGVVWTELYLPSKQVWPHIRSQVNSQESPWCLGVGGYPGGLSCRHGAHTWLT